MASANLGGSLTRRRLSAQMSALTGTLVAQGNLGIGRTFYVNSSSALASASNTGLDVQRPLTTIAGALALCTAGRGDTIVCGPGHTENITGAAAIALNKSGVTLVGKGNGRARPTLTWTTATTAQITVTAANVRISNFVFLLTGFDAVAAGFSVSAADCQFDNCEFVLADATNQAVLGILTTAAASRLTIRECQFYGTTDAGCTSVISLVGGDGIKILNNTFNVACGASAGVIAGATTDSTNILISGNMIQNKTASSTKVIVLTASSTGMITNNRLGILSGTAPITGAATQVGGNYYAAAGGVTAGTLL